MAIESTNEPTTEQLAARLNPTPVAIDVPTDGLFVGTGSSGAIFKREGDTITTINYADLLVPQSEFESL